MMGIVLGGLFVVLVYCAIAGACRLAGDADQRDEDDLGVRRS